MKRNNEKKKGFTLVELAIVIAVIAAFAVVMIGPIAGVLQNAKKSADMQEIKSYLESELAEFVMSERSSPKGIAFEREAGSDGIGYKLLTFTTNSHDMYEIMESNDFVLYTTKANIPNGINPIIINGVTKYFTNPGEAISAGVEILYVSKYNDRIFIGGAPYYLTTSISTVTAVETVQNTEVEKIYMPIAAQTADNTVDTSKSVKYADCDYIYTEGKNGYIFKVVVYKGTYEIIETGLEADEFEEKYGYLDVSDFVGYTRIAGENIVATSIDGLMKATMKRKAVFSLPTDVAATVQRVGSKYESAPLHSFENNTETTVYLGDTIRITVNATAAIEITEIKLNGENKILEFARNGNAFTYEFTVTDTVVMNIGVLYNLISTGT